MYQIIEQPNGTFVSKVITSSGILTDMHYKKIDAILHVISEALSHNHIVIFRDDIKFLKQSTESIPLSVYLNK